MHLLNNRLGRISALLVLGSAVAMAQGTQTANVTGTVVDKAGAPVAGVLVRLTSPALQGVRTYTTDATGKFIARLLPPGLYTIALNKDGMDSQKITQQVGIDQTFSPRITMVKSGGAVVEVIAAAPAVDKTDVKSATNFRLDSVDQLPTLNRTMDTVALLAPGVTSGVNGRTQMAGAMTSGNLYLLDGQNISDSVYRTQGVRTIDDAIEEIQVVTGAMSAEYGDVDGGIINSITKSGGNEFTGSLRWELSNPAWNGTQPFQNRAAIADILGETKTLNVTGPILKDRLWFSASYFTTKSNGVGTITVGPLTGSDPALGAADATGAGNTGFGSNYTTYNGEVRRQAKLTWAINQDHTLVASYQHNELDQLNRNYYAGEQLALVPQVSTSSFLNIALRSAWANNFTTELRYGHKQQRLTAGGAGNGQSPIYSDDLPVTNFYNNGIFSSVDGGDNRNNNTINFKASLFWDKLGSHQTDMGIDYIDEQRRAQNAQSPTGYIFEAAGVDLTTRTAIPTAVWTYDTVLGATDNFSYALYVNDKWSLNNHWNFQIGLRYDKYKAKNENGMETAGASGFSPRLGASYDLFGDSKHVFKASYARYNAKVLDTITGAVSGVGNPKEIDYYAYSFIAADPANGGANIPANRMSFQALQNLALYGIGNNAYQAYYGDPTFNVRLDPNLKAPTVDELEGSYAYSFDWADIGNGWVKATAKYKNWKNLLDYRSGNDGTVTNAAGATAYLTVYENNPDAKRTYKDLELEGQFNRNGWTIGGGITWASLKGNYEGEGNATPGSGQGLNFFNVQNGVTMFDQGNIHPYGNLIGDDAIRMRFNAAKSYDTSFGKTTVGWLYRFDTGSRYSTARNISRTRLNPGLSSQIGTGNQVQYYNNVWNNGVFPAAAYLDLSLTQDFPLFKMYGKTVWAFGKLVVQNVFNHQQQVGFNTTMLAATGTYGTPTGGVNSPWVPSSTYGQALSSGYYGTPRTIVASAGIRF
jgi:outer membrane receptor for ferrienterochelin and colicin